MIHIRSMIPPVKRVSVPLLLTLVILAGGAFARSPVADALARQNLSGVTLRTTFWYDAIAPASDLFDGLTLLSLPQILSAFAFAGAAAILLRIRHSGRRRNGELPALRNRDQIRFAANVTGAIVALSGLALLMPRPMAAIHLSDPDLLAVDFHSHTSSSHDGRPGFTPEANREWHRRAGFDVAYISDHHTFAGARVGMRANPRLAGEGTVLLTALEYRDDDEHVIALGLDPATTDPERREWHPLYDVAHKKPPAHDDAPALLILSLPGDVRRVPADEEIGVARLTAIELSDGSPRGIAQGAGDRADITSLAKRLNLALVSGSDNHGWGRAAIAWSVMRIPGWRRMSPVALDEAIRSKLVAGRASAVQVVSRRLPPAASALAIGFTGPMLAWEIVRDIGWGERLSWVVWMWGGWVLLAFRERRRAFRHVHIKWSLPEIVPVAGSERLAVSE